MSDDTNAVMSLLYAYKYVLLLTKLRGGGLKGNDLFNLVRAV